MLSMVSGAPRGIKVVTTTQTVRHPPASFVHVLPRVPRAVARPPQAGLVPPQNLMGTARPAIAATLCASGGASGLLAKAAMACMLGVGVRQGLEQAIKKIDFPTDPALMLTPRQKQSAIKTLSAVACLVCFALLL